MKIEARLFVGGVIFYFIVAIIYGVWSKDPIGITLLVFTGAMALMVGFFLWHTSRKVFPRPEDEKDAMPEDAEADYGFYSPYSWWPLALAASIAVIGFGLAFAAWLVVAGVVFLLLSLVGYIYEYYRGYHSH